MRHFNKSHFPDPKKRIDSYSFTQLIIAYLQYIGIFPNLKALGAAEKVVTVSELKFISKQKLNPICYMNKFRTDLGFEEDVEKIRAVFKAQEGT